MPLALNAAALRMDPCRARQLDTARGCDGKTCCRSKTQTDLANQAGPVNPKTGQDQ